MDSNMAILVASRRAVLAANMSHKKRLGPKWSPVFLVVFQLSGKTLERSMEQSSKILTLAISFGP